MAKKKTTPSTKPRRLAVTQGSGFKGSGAGGRVKTSGTGSWGITPTPKPTPTPGKKKAKVKKKGAKKVNPQPTPPPGATPNFSGSRPSRAGKKVAGKAKAAGTGSGGLSSLIKKYSEDAMFPNTSSKVQNFLVDAKIIPDAAALPKSLAQRIALKLQGSIPAGKAAEGLKGVATSLQSSVKNAPAGTKLSQVIAEWFEIKDTPIRNAAAKSSRFLNRTLPGAGTLLGGAFLARGLRDDLRESDELAMQERTSPGAEDIFKAAMLDELRTRSRMRTMTGAGGTVTGKQLIDLVMGAEEESGEMPTVSIPPSQGFPVR